ncbi:serine/threonine-protein kinase [Streptomyces zhihengii]
MGEVWQASDEVLGRPVALKLLLGEHADAQAAARFRLEAQTAARLNHPHVVAVFDFGTWDGRFYLVMELIPGRSLAEELTAAGGRMLAPERVAAVAAQTAAGLASAHRQGIVHRDIKPGNLLSDPEGTVKIADFGIARFVNDPSAALTTTGQIVGTSLYLAPERALGRTAEPASDVYALGCVLYQLLTGQPPFRADTPTATLYQHIDAVPVPPAELGSGSPRLPELPARHARQAAGGPAEHGRGRRLVRFGRLAGALPPDAGDPSGRRGARRSASGARGRRGARLRDGARHHVHAARLPARRGHRSPGGPRRDVRAAFRRRPRVATAVAGASRSPRPCSSAWPCSPRGELRGHAAHRSRPVGAGPGVRGRDALREPRGRRRSPWRIRRRGRRTTSPAASTRTGPRTATRTTTRTTDPARATRSPGPSGLGAARGTPAPSRWSCPRACSGCPSG